MRFLLSRNKILFIDNVTIGIVLDNVASNTVFIRELQLILQSEGINFDCEDCHFRCFAHILNLGVQDILRELRLDDPEECEESDSDYSKDEDVVATNNDALNNPIKRIRALFLKLKRSEQSTNMLKSACTMTGTKFLSPKIDVCTRWNSTHDMLKVALLLKPALISLFQSNTAFHMYLLSEEEWCLCSEVQKFLKHFKTVSTVLGGDSYVSLPYVIVAFNMLLDKIENKMQTLNRTDKLFNAYQAGRDKLLKHYQKSNWIYCICLVLDPRHKIESFNATTWGKEMKDQSVKKFEDLYKNEYFIPSESSLNNDLRNSSTDDDDDIDMSAIYEKSVSDSNWRNELTKYYNTRRADKDVDILAWWSTHSKEYPCLAKMARDFLGTPATSVPAERLFSKAGLIIRKHRNQLTAESARSLICLNSWYMSNLHLSE